MSFSLFSRISRIQTIRRSCQSYIQNSFPSWNQDCRERDQQQPQICRWYHSNGRKQRGTKEPLDEGERGEWKGCLKTQYSKNEDHGIQSHYLIANRGEKVETVTDFIFLGSKITVDCDCSHEIKRRLLLRRKLMTPRQHFKKADTSFCWQRSI